MASGEEARRPSDTSSSVGLESLFPPGASEHDACEEGSPELVSLRESLQGWLSPYEPLISWLQRLLVWERPLYSIFVALTLNTLFWLLSSTSLRPVFLLSVCLLGLILLDRWKHKLPLMQVPSAEVIPLHRASMGGEPRLLSVPELSHHLAESYLTCRLYLQETLQYKRQHHCKFCVVMTSGCLALALLGHYVPGIMISYIIVLSVLLWPLVVYHELIQKMYTGLEPILMKLDYSMKGDTEHRKHDKKKVRKEMEEGGEPRAETESESEEELSCFAPTVDVKTTALAMAITDSELSDEEASILESGGFSVSRATTPQLTDVSEDLDQQSLHSDPDEAYLRDLPEFPSVEEFPSVDHSLLHSRPGPAPAEAARSGAPPEGEALSPAALLFQHLASPLHFVNTHFNGNGQPAGGGGVPQTDKVVEVSEPEPREEEDNQEEEEEEQEEEEEEEEEEQEEEAAAGVHDRQQSLEALSEEIVSTAISTVVQNTLTALLRSGAAREEPALAHFLPAETPPGAMDPTDDDDDDDDDLIGAAPATDPPAGATTATTTDMPELGQVAEGAGPEDPEAEQEEEDDDDDHNDDEEEDFELLDQSELEQMTEERDTSADRPLVGGASGGPDTLPSPQHQPES